MVAMYALVVTGDSLMEMPVWYDLPFSMDHDGQLWLILKGFPLPGMFLFSPDMLFAHGLVSSIVIAINRVRHGG